MVKTIKATMAATLAAIIVLSGLSAQAGGPISHYYIGKRAADQVAGNSSAPSDLKQALADPACADAYASGAVSPDLGSLSDAGHYKDTSKIPQAMIANSRRDLQSANALPDDAPDKAAKVKAAQKELAFSYGWLSHCAADLNVHPQVNGMTGDAWIHNTTAQKTVHTAQEVQLDAFVDKTLRQPGEKIDYNVPYALVSKCTGVSEETLKGDAKWMRTKIAGEIVAKGKVTLPLDTLRDKWGDTVNKSLEESVEFAENPNKFNNLDIDAGGGMTTEEYETLRTNAIAANGGKLPADWGKKYIEWYKKTKGLSAEKQKAALAKLIKGEDISSSDETSAKNVKVTVKIASNTKMKISANGVDLSSGKSETVATKGSRTLTFKAMVMGERRDYCMGKTTAGTKSATIVEQSPYVFHFTVENENFRGETKWEVLKEEYNWSGAGDVKSKAFSSGVYPTVKNDSFEITVPQRPQDKFGVQPKYYTITVSGNIDWKMVRSAPTHVEKSESDTGSGGVTVIVEPE
ncbi:MAG: zinc dependent phospholipase C family protein [Armatimonadota bacterium]